MTDNNTKSRAVNHLQMCPECEDTEFNELSEAPKISVIIPCYNTEKYINDCLSSLAAQSFKDFEVICIDDGSTDKTAEIISNYTATDKRFKLIKQKNSGPSRARNKGMDIALGKHITFIDADDWIDTNYLEKLYNSASENDCDIAVSTVIRKRPNHQKFRLRYNKEEIYTSLKDKLDICNIPVCCYVWGKLYKADLIKNFKFKEGVFFEDVLWTPEVLKRANKLITVPDTNYYYRATKGSIVKTSSKKKVYDNYRADKQIVKFFDENGIFLPDKFRACTKEIKYFCNIPILKIKEKDNILTSLLFDFIPVYKKRIPQTLGYKTDKKFLFFRNLDNHLYIELLNCLKISFKKQSKFDYTEAKEYGLTEQPRETKLIVSLTSFPERIETVNITINTLLSQTVKPDKLILWLAESQFPNKEKDLPENLLKLKDLGLEIRWCEDLKSYKKLVPALQEFPNDIIVTADDDLYYRKDWLESLYSAYQKEPEYIYTRRACGMKLTNNILSVTPHYANSNYKPTFLNQLMGGAGTLYPPHTLYKDVFNTDLIKNLIPTHDDIYFWIMAVLNKTKIKLIKNKDVSFYNVEGSQDTSLCKKHGAKGGGMHPSEAFRRILKHYPQAYNLIEEDSVNV